MIDYIKLYNEFGIDTSLFYIGITITILIGTILLIIIAIYQVDCYLKNKDYKSIVKFSTLFLTVFSFFIYLGFYSVTTPEKEMKKRLIELKKYNVENGENFRNNVELLEKELEFYDEKENKINEILNEFYKPSGKTVDKEIMKKLKK